MAGEIEIEAVPRAEPDISGLVRCLLLLAAELAQRQADEDGGEVTPEGGGDD